MNWRDAAACSEEDPELFFPISGSGLGMVQIGEAKAVCGRCPVTFQCLEWALGAARWKACGAVPRRANDVRCGDVPPASG